MEEGLNGLKEMEKARNKMIREGKPCLWIIVPCYNEEEVVGFALTILLNKINELIKVKKISSLSKVLFVDDGSKDSTWELISGFAYDYNSVEAMKLSRNFGHQNAILAGIMEAKDVCDITITIDCDGQDDVDAINKMVDLYLDGMEIVYGVRSNRGQDSFGKRITAQIYYKFLQFLGGDIIYNHADFRLISARVLDAFSDFQEVNLFLRGLIPMLGFQSEIVYYERRHRMKGESHYTVNRMISLALDGITSLSIKPIRCITLLGFFASMVGFLGIIYAIFLRFNGTVVDGWTSMVCIINFLGGIQILGIGIIGEYIGKIYLETKRRPRYIVEEETW